VTCENVSPRLTPVLALSANLADQPRTRLRLLSRARRCERSTRTAPGRCWTRGSAWRREDAPAHPVPSGGAARTARALPLRPRPRTITREVFPRPVPRTRRRGVDAHTAACGDASFAGPVPAPCKRSVMRVLRGRPTLIDTGRVCHHTAVASRRPRRGTVKLDRDDGPPHGTVARYHRGCRCADCRTAKAADDREWREANPGYLRAWRKANAPRPGDDDPRHGTCNGSGTDAGARIVVPSPPSTNGSSERADATPPGDKLNLGASSWRSRGPSARETMRQ
jgi:hypothetical protein